MLVHLGVAVRGFRIQSKNFVGEEVANAFVPFSLRFIEADQLFALLNGIPSTRDVVEGLKILGISTLLGIVEVFMTIGLV